MGKLSEDFVVVNGLGETTENATFSSPYSFRIGFDRWATMTENTQDQLRAAAKEFASVLYHLGVGSGAMKFQDNRLTPEYSDPSYDPVGRRMVVPDTFLVQGGRYLSSVKIVRALGR